MTDLNIKQGVLVSLRGLLGRGVGAHGKGAAKSGQIRIKLKKTTGFNDGQGYFDNI